MQFISKSTEFTIIMGNFDVRLTTWQYADKTPMEKTQLEVFPSYQDFKEVMNEPTDHINAQFGVIRKLMQIAYENLYTYLIGKMHLLKKVLMNKFKFQITPFKMSYQIISKTSE